MKERQINAQINRTMSSRASSLLRRASAGFEPSASDKTKTRAAIARRVAIGAAAGAAISAGAKSAAAAPSLAPAALAPATAATTTIAPAAAATFASVGFATKLVAALAIVGTVSAGAVTVRHVTRATAPTSATQATASQMPAPIQAPADVQQTAAPQIVVQQTALTPTAADESASEIVPSPIANTLQKKPIQKVASPEPRAATPALQTGAEVALIKRAQQALQANDATSALALLNEHAQRFPNGQLAEDRDAARVLALCEAGRQEDAATAAAAFLSAHPSSTQVPRVRSSCANGASQ